MVRLRFGTKASVDLADLQGAERFFSRALEIPVVRREHDALTFDAGGQLRVRQGSDPGILELATNEDLHDLHQRLAKLGYMADLLPITEPDYLEVELGYEVACRIYRSESRGSRD